MDSTGAVGLDESLDDPTPPPSSPLPSPRSTRQPRSLFFTRSPQEEDQEDQLPPLTGEDDAAGSSTAGPWTTPESEFLDDDDPTSWDTSPAAGDKPVTQLLSKRQLKDTAEAAVRISTGMAHTVAAKTELQRQFDLYKADDDDAKAIGHPLAEIASRRGDVVGGKLSPDANNLLQSVLGIAGYFAKQVNKIGQIRQIEASYTAGDAVQQLPTDGA